MVPQPPQSDAESIRALLEAIAVLPHDAIVLDGDGRRLDGDGPGAEPDGHPRENELLIRFATTDGRSVTVRVALGDGRPGADGALLALAGLGVSTAAHGLTPREREVLRLVAGGLTTTGVADRLCISEPTVQKHVSSIKRRLGATTRAEAIAIAARNGLLD